MNRSNIFYQQLASAIQELGGMHNAHLHLDRAGTLDDRYFQSGGQQSEQHNSQSLLENSYISLHEKHALIASVHAGPAYDEADLRQRVNDTLDVMVACNTAVADSLVDVTPDRVGLSALETMTAIKDQRKAEIELTIGAYTPLGFNDAEPERWELFAEGARQADFIAALPEADDVQDYPANIGFEEHCRRTLSLAQELDCMLHVHTDQRNDPRENGTERLFEVMQAIHYRPDLNRAPQVWAVHMISPSTYDEKRFRALVENMLELHVGLICCPSAAIGMRQFRPLKTPTYNSIPRVLELLEAGVQVRLASDNIADICSPSTTANLVDEIFILSAALRFYNVDILAKLACARALNQGDKELLAIHLERNAQEISKAIQHY